MSRCATLALILSVTACEHAQPMTQREPTFEAARPAPIEPAPAPTPPPPLTEPAAAPIAPAPKVAPKPAEPVDQPTAEAPKKKLVKKCNPMSRAGCRWSEEVDERFTPRVVKKQPAGDTTTEGSAP